MVIVTCILLIIFELCSVAWAIYSIYTESLKSKLIKEQHKKTLQVLEGHITTVDELYDKKRKEK